MKSSLVKIIDDILYVAEARVATPEYTIFVSEGVSAFGWEHVEDDVNTDIIKKWEPPTAQVDPTVDIFPIKPLENEIMYWKGDVVFYKDQLWVSVTDRNTTEPGKEGDTWALASKKAEEWKEKVIYSRGDVVLFKKNLWVSLKDENSEQIGEETWKNVINFYPSSKEEQGVISIGKKR